MSEFTRGSLVWAKPLNDTSDTEVFAIFSDSRFNAHSGTVLAFPVTAQRQKTGYPFVVPHLSFSIKISQLRPLSTARLSRPFDTLNAETLQKCAEALALILGL